MLEKRFCQVVPVGVVRNRRPEKAKSAPMAVVQRGAWALAGRRAGKMVKRGEDYDEASDEGGFGCSGSGKAGGLELVSGGEEEADDEAGDEGFAGNVS